MTFHAVQCFTRGAEGAVGRGPGIATRTARLARRPAAPAVPTEVREG